MFLLSIRHRINNGSICDIFLVYSLVLLQFDHNEGLNNTYLYFQDPEPLPYLKHSDPYNFDIHLEVAINGNPSLNNKTTLYNVCFSVSVLAVETSK